MSLQLKSYLKNPTIEILLEKSYNWNPTWKSYNWNPTWKILQLKSYLKILQLKSYLKNPTIEILLEKSYNYLLHPISHKFPERCLWNTSHIDLIDYSHF